MPAEPRLSPRHAGALQDRLILLPAMQLCGFFSFLFFFFMILKIKKVVKQKLWFFQENKAARMEEKTLGLLLLLRHRITAPKPRNPLEPWHGPGTATGQGLPWAF